MVGQRPRRCIVWIALSLTAGMAVFGSGSLSFCRDDDDLSMPRPLSRQDRLHAYQGATSCAAAACHNADTSLNRAGAEYKIWIAQDKHARAFAVLYDQRSVNIEHNLNPVSGAAKDAHPEKDALCLRCHAPAGLAAGPQHQSLADSLAEEGVSCEGCHGPAQHWRTTHYLAGWKGRSAADRASTGFHDLKDLSVRAETCAACHVGAGDRQVNHDLIAAGHPALNFEYGAYLALMPKHWNVAEEKRRFPDLEARVWLLGQVVSARTALALLAEQASQARAPWPEFAEYECYACHHNLTGAGWRQRREGSTHPLGALRWQTWYTALLPEVFEAQSPGAGRDWLGGLCLLRAEMVKRQPDRRRVARLARQLAAGLGPALEQVNRSRYDDPAWLQRVGRQLADSRRLTDADWATQTQLYCALAALYQARADLDPRLRRPPLRAALEDMRQQLRFPGSGSNRQNSPDETHALLRQQKFDRALRVFRTHLDW